MARKVQLALDGEQTRELAERPYVLMCLVHNPLQVLGVQHVLTASLIDKPQTA
jgi:hypothetical protein